jgi:hypothetical protein
MPRPGKSIKELLDALSEMPGIARADIFQCDIVFDKGIDYDDARVNPGSLSKSESASWRERFFDSQAQRAVAQHGEETGSQHRVDVHLGLEAQERGSQVAPAERGAERFSPTVAGAVPIVVFEAQRWYVPF